MGALLETGVDGFISVGLANGSQLSLPTRSRLRLNSMVRILLTNAVRFDVTVDGGKLETSATPLTNGGSAVQIGPMPGRAPVIITFLGIAIACQHARRHTVA